MPGVFTLMLIAVALVVLAARALPRLRRGPSAPSAVTPLGHALYHELLRSPVPTDLFYELEILLQPTELEFGWRSPALDKARALGITERLIGGGGALWVTLLPGDITELDRRRLSTPQALTEIVTPYAGLGLTGEVKFRIRGVRTGIFIRTTAGKRYWLATRHPDELIAAIEAARDPEQGPPPPPPRTT